MANPAEITHADTIAKYAVRISHRARVHYYYLLPAKRQSAASSTFPSPNWKLSPPPQLIVPNARPRTFRECGANRTQTVVQLVNLFNAQAIIVKSIKRQISSQ